MNQESVVANPEEALADVIEEDLKEPVEEPEIKTSAEIKTPDIKQDIDSQDYPGSKDGLIKEIDNEVSVILQHAQEIKHISDEVSKLAQNYTKELNEQLDTWSRENFLTNLVDKIKSIGKENYGSSRNIEQSALRIDRTLKELRRRQSG